MVGHGAAVPTKIELIKVALGVLVANVVERADDSALEQGEVGLCRIGVNDAAHVLFAVVNDTVTPELLIQPR